METLLLIDGNAIMHRAFFAIPADFRSSDGTPTNAVYGFMTMLHKVISDFHPQHVIICFDTPKPTFRQKLLPSYQAQRPKAASEFIVQIPLIKEMIDKAGICRIEKEGYEADDLIGTLTAKYKKNHRILIFTGDKDIMQLIESQVFVITPQTGVSSIKLYDEEEVVTKMGVSATKIPELKALMGDPSDNYPGAKGIGPKTAVNLLNQFLTVENLLNHTSEIKNERIKSIIETNQENIILSKKLATILQDVPYEIDIEKVKFEGFKPELKGFLEKLQIRSLIERIFNQRKERIPKEPAKKKSDDTPSQDSLF
ncbi:MAG: hypothetical protein HYW86_02555 [Candidatus Roizmanbacteria bacterium]|nr:MAG: hypothetical protein HYW86_02555 [Candidatus Roizmanbacteria bacterium]